MARRIPETGSMSEADRVVEFLGGTKVFRNNRPATMLALTEAIRTGIPYAAFLRATHSLKQTPLQLSRSLQFKTRTMARRKQAKGRLTPGESERLVRLARVVSRAEDILGSSDGALAWLERPNADLAGKTPLSLLDTDVGAEAVLNTLSAMHYGFPA
jgi:putative toxin-antitoxin system antitoxin component (TIGR02293 family)